MEDQAGFCQGDHNYIKCLLKGKRECILLKELNTYVID